MDEDDGDGLVYQWRLECLYSLGVDWGRASEYADVVDPHDVERLVVRGCPPDLALEIARP